MKSVFRLKLIIVGMFWGTAQATDPAPIQLDTTKLPPGILVKFAFNSLPVFVLHRRPAEINALRKNHAADKASVTGCASCDPVLRSISPSFLVIWGYNPSSGCELFYASSTATGWQGHQVHGRGGFVDKCTATEYDLTGRKLSGPQTSPDQLSVPPHSYKKGVITIEANQASVSNTSVKRDWLTAGFAHLQPAPYLKR